MDIFSGIFGNLMNFVIFVIVVFAVVGLVAKFARLYALAKLCMLFIILLVWEYPFQPLIVDSLCGDPILININLVFAINSALSNQLLYFVYFSSEASYIFPYMNDQVDYLLSLISGMVIFGILLPKVAKSFKNRDYPKPNYTKGK